MDAKKTHKIDIVIRPWAKTIKEAAKKHPKHFFRYDFVQKSIEINNTTRMLDAACGTGYGAKLLGENAKKLVAIDISGEAIQWANKYFQAPSIEFRQADLGTEHFLNSTEKFDVITSFETLEHLTDPEKFLDCLNEHLVPEGKLFLSVPNGAWELARGNSNPYHIHNFDGSKLKSLVEANFQKVSYFSCFYNRGWRHKYRKWLKSLKIVSTTHLLSNYYYLPGLHEKCKNFMVRITK